MTLHSKVKVRLRSCDEDGKIITRRVETTPGRAMVMDLVPKVPGIDIEICNRLLTKREISDAIDFVYRHCGQKATVLFADHVMALGFKHACLSGISFGKDDLIIPRGQGNAGHCRARKGQRI